MAKSFLSYQEFYENRHFADKVFSKRQFKKWYVEQYGKFSYYTDWEGFNVPGSVLHTVSANFDGLSPEEKNLVKKLAEFGKADIYSGNVYVIGTLEKDSGAIEHELTHALFFLNADYRQQVMGVVLGHLGIVQPIMQHLYKISYHPKTLLDEINAYIVHEKTYLISKNLWDKRLGGLQHKLQSIRAKYNWKRRKTDLIGHIF